MIPLIETLNFYLALGGIVSFLLALILLVDQKRDQALRGIVRSYGLLIALIISGIGTVSALIYSEVFLFEPCSLCWLARICLFAQVPLLLTALYVRDTLYPRYGLTLSLIGIVITLYHHYLQMGGSALVRCPTGGGDCAQRFLFEFGFMTFPLLATAGFVLLSALYFYILKTRT